MNTTHKPIKIIGMGKYLPKSFSSSEIEKLHGIPLGYSEKYSGVSSRHHVQLESIGYMGARAAEHALLNANLSLASIDMLISAGGTFDYAIPNQASVIKSELTDGTKYNFPAIDIDSTCLSFVTALDIAAKLLDGKTIKTLLIVSSEVASKGLNTDNWETATLFGDGAAAAVVQYSEDAESYYIKGLQKTYTEGVNHAIIEGGGIVNHFKDYPYNKELYSFKMSGKKMLRLGKSKIPDFINVFFSDQLLEITDISIIIPHAASKTALYILEQSYPFKPNQIKNTLQYYGNCIAASIPLTLADCIEKGEIKRGDTCLLIGTSAGFSIGGLLFKY
jgi:3-oxoacyl-[acyl-carrier-protein] synthase III